MDYPLRQTSKKTKIKTWSLMSNLSLGSLQFRRFVFSLYGVSYFEGCLQLKIVFHQRFFQLKGVFHWKLSLIVVHLSLTVVFHQISFFIKSCLPSKVILHRRSSSKVVFHQRASSINDHLPSKVVYHHRLSSIEGWYQSKVMFPESFFPSKVVFNQRLSSIKGLASKFIFFC